MLSAESAWDIIERRIPMRDHRRDLDHTILEQLERLPVDDWSSIRIMTS